MKDPAIFLAYNAPDPTAGGLVTRLLLRGIQVVVLPAQQSPPNKIPSWVIDHKSVDYYVVTGESQLQEAVAIARESADANAVIKP